MMGAKKKFSGDGIDSPRDVSFSISLDATSYDRLCYVADYFDWPMKRVASNCLVRCLQSVKFGEDLSLVAWCDPRRSLKK